MPKDLIVDDVYGDIYTAERLLTSFGEQYFSAPDDVFLKDKAATDIFVSEYEYMQAKIRSISLLLFDIRVRIELSLGIESPAVLARIRNEQELLDMYNDARRHLSAASSEQ